MLCAVKSPLSLLNTVFWGFFFWCHFFCPSVPYLQMAFAFLSLVSSYSQHSELITGQQGGEVQPLNAVPFKVTFKAKNKTKKRKGKLTGKSDNSREKYNKPLYVARIPHKTSNTIQFIWIWSFILIKKKSMICGQTYQWIRKNLELYHFQMSQTCLAREMWVSEPISSKWAHGVPSPLGFSVQLFT